MDNTLYDHRYALRHAVAELRRADPRLSPFSLAEIARRDEDILQEVHRGMVLAGTVSVDEGRAIRLQRLYSGLGLRVTEDEAQNLALVRRQAYLEHQRAVPGASALLRALRSQGLWIGIVSNHVAREQERKLRSLRLRDLVDALIVSGEVGVNKPDPRIFRVALSHAGVPPGSAVMVGDSWEDDVLGARAAGIRAVWFHRGGGPARRAEGVSELRSFRPRHQALATILGPGRKTG